MNLTKEGLDKFIKFLYFFMNISRKKQLDIIKKFEKELSFKCLK